MFVKHAVLQSKDLKEIHNLGNSGVIGKTILEVNNKNPVALVRERNIPTARPPLVGEVVPTFADRG
jgi:hypothetical protein